MATQDAENVLTNTAGLDDRKKRVDAVAKLTGEGSRWQAVMAAAAYLTDNTLFFVPPTQHADGLAIRLKDLWLKWGAWFNSAFNINNATFEAGIRGHANDPAVLHIRRNTANAFINSTAYDLTQHRRITLQELEAMKVEPGPLIPQSERKVRRGMRF